MPLNPLRNFPSISELLESPPLKAMVSRISHNAVVDTARTVLEEVGKEVQNSVDEKTLPNVSELAERIARRVMESEPTEWRKVINATGMLLHGELGHAPLAEEAIAEIASAARDYAGLEIDLQTGKRSRRDATVETLLKELTGAEAAMVAPSHSAAMLLTLAALAADREAIVSRGQILESDDGCRLSDVTATAGIILHEVGTANVTRLDDYAQAISDYSAAILLVEQKACAIEGIAESVELPALVELGKKHRLPVIHDLDSGTLIDFAKFGLSGRPMAKESIAAGADVVILSGDKLIGGPQCGIILGRRASIEKIQKHPLARALMADKLTLAALAATVRLYDDEEKAKLEVPLLRLLGTSSENLKNRAERLAPQMAAVKKVIASAEPVELVSSIDSSPIPSQHLPTWCIALTPAGMTVDRLAAALRAGTPPVVGRIQPEKDRLLLDLRSVFPRQDTELVAAVEELGKAS